MILVAIGANLPSPLYGPPLATCRAALLELEKSGLIITGVSRWYESAPIPVSSQPWYVNGVIAVKTTLSAPDLLSGLLVVEEQLGRVRGQRNAARILDLDLIAYHDLVLEQERAGQSLILPHPRLHERAFVLCPLADVAPGWRHPQTGQLVDQLIANLENPHSARPLIE